MCDYQCTSISFIILSNQIEKWIRQRESNLIKSNYFSPNQNALVIGSVCGFVAVFVGLLPR